MAFTLHRLDDATDPRAGSLLLGVFPSFQDALVAADEDTVRLFSLTCPGAVMLVRHDIIAPAVAGTTTRHPVTTAIERQEFGDAQEIDEVRGWLTRLHAPTD